MYKNMLLSKYDFFFFFQAEDGIRDVAVTGVQTCALPIWEALKGAPKVRIHTFISTSDIHLKHQFRVTREQARERAVEMVTCARGYLEDVESWPMDARRSDVKYLYEVLEAAIEAGATTVNIPDTVGYATPQEFGRLIRGIRENVPNIKQAVISVHCHNDLGMAVSNSLAAVMEGAGQRSEEHTSELQSRLHLVCRLLLEKKKKKNDHNASMRH